MTYVCTRTIGLIGLVLGLAMTAGAALTPAGASVRNLPRAEENPDWPCVQRLVPAIAPGMIWTGPSIDSVDRSADDPAVEQLAGDLAARRTPLEEARRRIDEFAGRLDPANRNETLTRLFAETLEIINRDRASIVQGIRRFARQQRELSDEIRRINAALRELAADDAAERQARREILEEDREWSVRIYDEREASLTYLCEQPVLFEQRAFALAREIAGNLD